MQRYVLYVCWCGAREQSQQGQELLHEVLRTLHHRTQQKSDSSFMDLNDRATILWCQRYCLLFYNNLYRRRLYSSSSVAVLDGDGCAELDICAPRFFHYRYLRQAILATNYFPFPLHYVAVDGNVFFYSRKSRNDENGDDYNRDVPVRGVLLAGYGAGTLLLLCRGIPLTSE